MIKVVQTENVCGVHSSKGWSCIVSGMARGRCLAWDKEEPRNGKKNIKHNGEKSLLENERTEVTDGFSPQATPGTKGRKIKHRNLLSLSLLLSFLIYQYVWRLASHQGAVFID